MKLFKKMKDGGQLSTVTGYWLIESKSLFSTVLLKFEGPSREAYHEHAFNCISWVLKGMLFERFLHYPMRDRYHKASWKPFITRRDDFHKVDSVTDVSWVLSIRGPWINRWREFLPSRNDYITLKSGREVVYG